MSRKRCHDSGGIYFLAFIGALVYNIQYAEGFSQLMWGFFKSLFWPAFLIYELLAQLMA